ncbi:MAG: tRNA 2-thiouridine(34) synthase MnmA [Lentisphaerota bacterium]
MSGGVDSSVAAALLVEQGFQVLGITARMQVPGANPGFEESCKHAHEVASFLGIRHVTLDAAEYFERMVLDPFLAEYHSGRTPSPCVLCNQHVKFGHLLMRAAKLGCSRIATGHYARLEKKEDGVHLFKGRDASKDQSYFLHRLSQEQLEKIWFPLGTWTKQETRKYAQKRGLPVEFREESQDLCFIENHDHAGFLERSFPDLKKKGWVVDSQGKVLGEHEGYHRYTIGQREGLGVAAKTRLYVKEIRPSTNEVVAGPREEIFSSGCRVDEVAWMCGALPSQPVNCAVKLRYRHEGAPSTVSWLENQRACVMFDTPQFGVTPGQAAVFYQGDEVLGGGWISESIT